MKVKIKDLSQEQRMAICKSISFADCCEPACPLWDKEGKCSGETLYPASPEFEEKEIEVEL